MKMDFRTLLRLQNPADENMPSSTSEFSLAETGLPSDQQQCQTTSLLPDRELLAKPNNQNVTLMKASPNCPKKSSSSGGGGAKRKSRSKKAKTTLDNQNDGGKPRGEVRPYLTLQRVHKFLPLPYTAFSFVCKMVPIFLESVKREDRGRRGERRKRTWQCNLIMF